IELDQFQNRLARFAVEGQADHGFANPDDRSGRQVIKSIEVDDNIFAKITGVESAFGHDRSRRDQDLTKWRTRDVAANAVRAMSDGRHGIHGAAVVALNEKICYLHIPAEPLNAQLS